MATQRKDGRWQAKAKDPETGKWKVVYGKTEQEAERAKREAFRTTSTSRRTETVHDCAKDLWWPTVEASCRPFTQKKYQADYRNHIGPKIGHVRLTELRKSHCQNVVNSCLAKPKGKDPRKASYKVRENVAMLMASILSFAVADKLIPENPATGLTLGKKPPKRRRYMSPQKAREVLGFFEGSQMRCPILLAFLGLREAEIANLRWEHLDTERFRLRIAGQAMKETGKPLYSAPTKGAAGERTLKIGRELCDLILAAGDQDSPWIASWEGRQAYPHTYYKKWADARGYLGLSDWTFHDLRHGAQGLLVSLGVHPFTIMGILGHTKVDTTLVYEAMEEELQEEAMSRIGGIFGASASTSMVSPDTKAQKGGRLE